MEKQVMTAAVCTRYGGPEVIILRMMSLPEPGPDEVLIAVKASTVNSADVRMRSLDVKGVMKLAMRITMGFRKPKNGVLGVTFSGEVQEVGEKVSRFKAGDKVFGLTGFRFGAHAPYLALKESATMIRMPGNAGFEEAAALPFGAHTAIHFLQAAGIEHINNAKVMIYGSTGSVGISAIQMAKHYGAEVTAVCSSAGEALMRRLDIEHVICYDQVALSGIDRKFDIIFDAVGKVSRSACPHLLKPKGKFVTVGGLAVAREKKEQLNS